MAFEVREAELRVVRAGADASVAAVRELLALQSSDWPFLVTQDLAPPYGRERHAGHLRELERALAGEADARGPRNLAVDADPAVLLAP
jgi:1,4-alpha-glucan branching enzyme